MAEKVNVITIVGSLRKGSYNAALARELPKFAPAGMSITVTAGTFTNSAGASVPVRWSAVAQQAGGEAVRPGSVGKDYLFDDLIHAVAQRSLTWKLVLTVGEPGDQSIDVDAV